MGKELDDLVQVKQVLLLEAGDVFPVGKVTKELLMEFVRQDEAGRLQEYGIPITFADGEGDLCVGFIDRLWLGQQLQEPKNGKEVSDRVMLFADIHIKRELLPADADTFFPSVSVIMEDRRVLAMRITTQAAGAFPDRFFKLDKTS